MSELPPLESSAKTAIGAGSSGKGGTVGSYITADKLFSQQGGTKLDYGSGRGEGAKLIKADTYEPYVKSKPNYSASSQIPSNSYDKVTSLNVLNVIPPKERKEAVKEIARVLKPNGEAIISTRGKDVEAAKTKVKVKDGYVIGKGDQARFQKGFGVEELKKYVQKILGKGFTVQPVKLGKAAVKITKGGAGKSPLEDKQFGFPKPELFDVADPAMKTNFNEGGTVMEKQESGLADDGGTIEEESGNEVPVGSLENEVKDDIDAKLSEGEFVFPADVVRFIGLNKLMAMRQKAKQGLQKMEDMGQMGNADEATVPDTMEWDENEMIKADTENEFNKGGIALAPGGVTTTRSDQGSRFQGLQPTPTTTSPEEEDDEIDEILDVEEDTDFEDVAEDAEEGILTYEQLMGGVENFYEIRSFYNPDTKRIHRVAFINGEATSPVPDSWIDTKSEEYDTLIKEQQQNTEKEVVQEINGIAPESDKNENEVQRENEERREYTKQVLGLSETSSEGNSITDIFNKGSDASGDPMLKRISRAVLMNSLGVPLWAAIIGEKLGVTKKLAGAINASLAGDESEETQEILKEGKTDVIETAKKHSPIYMDSPDYTEDRFKKPLGAGGVIAPTVQDYFDGKKDVYEYLNSKDQLTVMFGSSSAPEFMLRDFDDDYKTMDPWYMESVWWVFKQLWDKGLVYKGFKVMPISTALGTPLANFEVSQNYRDVQDPAVTVLFKVRDQDKYLAAWTTTPWTLPSNLAVCVGDQIDYVLARDVSSDKDIYFAEELLGQYGEFEVLERVKGSELVGLEYEPMFEYFEDQRASGAFVVVSDDYVTTDGGTGLVHQAPAFGEDDYRVLTQNGIEAFACPVGLDGRFDGTVSDFAGLHVKEADKLIIEHLKSVGSLYRQEVIQHSYPFCPRSDTPLIYVAIPAWYVRTSSIIDKLVAANEQIHWVPEHIKEGRFGNWLKGAIDWGVSRNRVWGTPIPIWINDETEALQ